MTATDDWEPLPTDHLASHPGEFAPLDKVVGRAPSAPETRAVAATEPKRSPAGGGAGVKAADSARATAAPADPAAERALQQLKARLAKAPPPTSLIAEVQRREAKQERRQRAARAPQLVGSAPLVVEGLPTVPLPVAYQQGPDGRDPREDEPWFADLPPAEQQRLHQQWALERVRFDSIGLVRRRQLLRVMVSGALVSFVFALLQVLLLGGFGYVPLLTAGGAVAAGAAQACGGGRFAFAAAGGFVYMLIMVPVILVNPYALTGVMLAGYGMGAVGMEEEMRRSGGFDSTLP